MVAKKNGYHRQLGSVIRLVLKGSVSINSIVWPSCAKRLFSVIHLFMVSIFI